MKRWFLVAVALALALSGVAAIPGQAVAQDGQARVRVVHASPDAPPVDVLVDGNVAIRGLAFGSISPYASLSAAPHTVRVVPSGATEPVVIDTTLTPQANTDTTVVAVGQLANIEPLVLQDDNSTPPAGQARVRFVHASPDAPAVDVAVEGGPVLFSNVSFKGVGAYTTVDAGTYDLAVRPAGSTDVVLSAPDVTLNEGGVYTVFAVGLAEGQPGLRALVNLDNADAAMLPDTGAAQPQLPGVVATVLDVAWYLGQMIVRQALAA